LENKNAKVSRKRTRIPYQNILADHSLTYYIGEGFLEVDGAVKSAKAVSRGLKVVQDLP
jgi:hypothetical protein